ncbi:MAG TPA: transcription termination/antitermination protein NusA [Anaerolineae bacterium]|nr:transcription termination/antitermination protein NusA [Anaerolineae bacterium]
MKSEFALAFNEIIERFGLPQDTVMETLEAAMISAYRRSTYASSAQNVEVEIDSETGEVHVYAEKEVVEKVENPSTEVSLEKARKFEPDAELGGVVMVESTPKNFGRVAAQTAKQVMLQRLREAEREAQYAEFIEREGDMVHGTVHSITPQAVTVGLLGRAEAILPRNQQIPGERFRVRDRIRVYVLEVRKSSRGPVIVVSRTHPAMLRRLLEMEVPEIHQGLVEIKAIAREAGKRAKVAVAALREGVDPVGACVGLRGVRIQSVVRDLNDEKIDVIEWNPDPATFIAKALSPARVAGVYLDEDRENSKTAMVVVPEDQLSLAIGRAGVNARLAAKLTGWRIDIKSLPESAVDSIALLTSDKTFEDIASREVNLLPEIETVLTKKAENRPVTPEEYQKMRDFVDRVQLEVMGRRETTRKREQEKLEAIRAVIPSTAYDVALEDIGLSTRVLNLLTQEGYLTAGQVMEQLELDEDKILALPGVGPKAMQELQKKLTTYEYPEVEVEVVVEEVPEVEEEVVEVPEVLEVLEPLPEEPQVSEAEIEEPVEVVVEAEEGLEVEEAPEALEPVATVEEVFDTYAEDLEAIVTATEEGGEEEIFPFDEDKRMKRKKVSRVVEYDPDTGEMIVKRRRKRAEEDWEDLEY